MALDGIVRMVDAFFRHWDDTEKMVGVRARRVSSRRHRRRATSF
jgi:hypothetical protein